jgi:hypothetical protein
MMRTNVAHKRHATITPSTQYAHQADGSSPLPVFGETRLKFHHDGYDLIFEGPVVDNLNTPILAGIPFMEINDITIRPARQEIRVGDNCVFKYGSKAQTGHHTIRLTQALRAPVPNTTTLWPGEFNEIKLPDDMTGSDEYNTFSFEPASCQYNPLENWPPPSFIDSVAGKVRIAILTNEPHTIKRNQHLGLVRPTYTPNDSKNHGEVDVTYPSISYSLAVKLNPDMKRKHSFKNFSTHTMFNPDFEGYNGASGTLKAVVNMGPVKPPQWKGRLPQYNKHLLSTTQDKLDMLESRGIFIKPKLVNVEYVNPSFLVKTPSGGFKLVTAFADVGRYSKSQPSLMPDVDSTLRLID